MVGLMDGTICLREDFGERLNETMNDMFHDMFVH